MPRRTSWCLGTIAALCLSLAGFGGCSGKRETPASDPAPRAEHPTPPQPAPQPQPAPGTQQEPSPTPPAENAELDREQLRGLRGGGAFFNRPDGDIRERLATLPIKEIKRGYGGRSVAFKITLEDGTTGYYKPNQTFSAAHWWSEVAAYHLDRLLGLGHTPPVVSRRFQWEPLRRVAPEDEHFPEVLVDADGTVPGSFSYWIPDRLVPITLPAGWERWVRVQPWPANAISPYQRPREYTEAIRAREAARAAQLNAADPTAEPGEAPAAPLGNEVVPPTAPEPGTEQAAVAPTTATPAAPAVAAANPTAIDPATVTDSTNANEERAAAAPTDPSRAADLSDLLVFDFLTLNTDRWGGGNANVLTRGGREIVFLDNAAGFPRGAARNGLMDARLRVVQRFRRSTIDAIRALDLRALQRRMQSEPCAPILDDNQIGGLALRRRLVLERVAEMQAQFGDSALPW